jgi:hypothetical protein
MIYLKENCDGPFADEAVKELLKFAKVKIGKNIEALCTFDQQSLTTRMLKIFL